MREPGRWLLLLLLLGLVAVVRSEEDVFPSNTKDPSPRVSNYTIFPSAFAVYDTGDLNRTVFVRGAGFAEGMTIEFDPPLKEGKRVRMSLVEDSNSQKVFKLQLDKGKTWLRDGTPRLPYGLISAVRLRGPQGTILYEAKTPIAVARVYPRPQITASVEKIPANSPRLTIAGKDFSRKSTLVGLNPPLVLGEDYVSEVSPDGGSIHLTLLPGSVWRTSPGPLSVASVSSAPGELRVSVQIAEIVDADPALESVTKAPETRASLISFENAESLEEIPTVYRTFKGTPTLVLKGSGFDPSGPAPRVVFKSGTPKQTEDFDVRVTSSTELELHLKKGRAWLPETESLPAYLVVSSLDGRAPSATGELATVAWIVETPHLKRSSETLAHNTQTTSIAVRGGGFPAMGLVVEIPGLEQDEDFYVQVLDPRTFHLILFPGKSWVRQGDGGSSSEVFSNTPLVVTSLAVEDGKPVVQNKDAPEKGVRVAMIEPDFEGELQLEASSQVVYRSFTRELVVNVTNLPPGYVLPEASEASSSSSSIRVEMGPEGLAPSSEKLQAVLTSSEDYAAELRIRLGDAGTTWWEEERGGSLVLRALWLNDVRYPLGSKSGASGKGVHVARVIRDVRVFYPDPPPVLFESQSNLLVLKGSGFSFSMQSPLEDHEMVSEEETNRASEEGEDEDEVSLGGNQRVALAFEPVLIQDEDFSVEVFNGNELRLRLLPGKAWGRGVPGGLTTSRPEAYLRLVGVDAGAGLVPLKDVILARLMPDDPDLVCENDCAHAMDGVCDDRGGVCAWGSDCADCGPREPGAGMNGVSPEADQVLESSSDPLCNDDCGSIYVRDGICDDGRPGTWQKHCPLGTDCFDCGPLPVDKFAGRKWCTNGMDGSGDSVRPGLACVFPFTLDGITYTGESSCVTGGVVPHRKDERDQNLEPFTLPNAPWGWCSLTANFEKDRQWGTCQYCSDVLDQPDEAMTSAPESSKEKRGKKDKKAKKNNNNKSVSARAEAEASPRVGGQAGAADFLRRFLGTLVVLTGMTLAGWVGFVLYSRRTGNPRAFWPGGTPHTGGNGGRYELVSKGQ